jgi:hypothetical protein
MGKSSIRSVCQIYLLVILLAAAVLSSLPYSPLALALLLLMLFITFRPPPPRFNIVITVLATFLLPMAVEPLIRYLTYTTLLSPTIVQLLAVIAVLPTIYLLDYNLRRNAETMTIVHSVESRNTTTILNTLLVATISMFLVSLIVNNLVLLFTVLALILYLLAILIRLLYAIPRLPLDIPTAWKRVIAGTTADVPLYAINKASVRLYSLVSPVDSWVRITPKRFTLGATKTELNISVTPPLAGPSRPRLQVSLLDPRGFLQINQIISPLELHVIPRARYAEWLARRYLEQTGTRGTTTAAAALTEAVLKPRRGIEYYDSRGYQPGDPLKDIDWKHTVKLSQIIIKEYIEAGGQASIIGVNLSVADAEEADKLAFNLITAALTHARESIPAALAVYNHEKVILNTPVSDPREILKQTLLLVKNITSVELAHRFLQPPDIGRIRRNIALLKQVTSQPAQQLLNMLRFEYEAIEEAAKNHPASLALLRASKQVQPPALIVLLSHLNHDTEALMVATEKLSKRGFTRLHIGAAELSPRRILSRYLS